MDQLKTIETLMYLNVNLPLVLINFNECFNSSSVFDLARNRLRTLYSAFSNVERNVADRTESTSNEADTQTSQEFETMILKRNSTSILNYAKRSYVFNHKKLFLNQPGGAV